MIAIEIETCGRLDSKKGPAFIFLIGCGWFVSWGFHTPVFIRRLF